MLSGEEVVEFHNPVEGPAMLSVGILGILFNIVCFAALIHKKELKLSSDYLFLLRAQSIFDILYLLTSTPITMIRYLSKNSTLVFVLPWIFPFVQITMITSIYITIALALERYLCIRDIALTKTFPCRLVLAGIVGFSVCINIPRFFELEAVEETDSTLIRLNDTGFLHIDWAIETSVEYQVRPKENYTISYFLGYNMIGSFIFSLVIPVITLSILNTLIWKRLQDIWKNQNMLRVREKRNTRAAMSLVLIVIFFVCSHSLKLVVTGYQLVDSLVNMEIQFEWPHWVEICTFLSHLLLALNASIHIFLFCSCDRRFFVIVQKTLKSWFIWPLTVKTTSYFERMECGHQNLPIETTAAMEMAGESPTSSGNRPFASEGYQESIF